VKPRGRALVVTPRLPWPLDDGGRLGLWQFVVAVARDRATTLVALVPPDEPEVAAPAELARLGVEVVRVPHAPSPRALAVARSLFDPEPVALARYRSPRLEHELAGLVVKLEPDFVMLHHLHLAACAAACRPAPVVLRQHNVESLWWERYAASLGNPLTRIYARDQARRMRAAEARRCAAVDLVLAIHEEEAQLLRRMAPSTAVEVVPFAMPFGELPPAAVADAAPALAPVVLLLATWSWPPNVRGALRFLAEGWAALAAAVPGVRLRIVGKGAPASLRAAAAAAPASASIEWLGYVPDLAAVWAGADALLVPLWEGAGVRVKIVEALAAGVPIVATPLGAEGLELEAGRDYQLGRTAVELAQATAALLARPDRGRAQARAAHERARRIYSQEAMAERLAPLLDRVAEQRS